MMNKEEYKRELIRMWDSLRTENKGGNSCHGVECNERCAFYGDERSSKLICYDDCINAVEMVEAIEKWSREHQPKKLTRFEFEMLKWLDKAGYKFIVRGMWDNVMANDSTPEKKSNGWVFENEYKDLTEFNELFQFIKWADEEPTSIQDVLKNCEVKEDV